KSDTPNPTPIPSSSHLRRRRSPPNFRWERRPRTTNNQPWSTPPSPITHPPLLRPLAPTRTHAGLILPREAVRLRLADRPRR
uniref:Uncharacterized protein n=1 Tax=Triticum urartu TaxID=4572 RepID=A0A8R7PA01_TRIUA